jgi:hypothetical protein
MKKILILIITITTLLSCYKDDCTSPFIPPQVFIFEIVDKITRENLFTNGTYQPEQIQITNTDNNFSTEFIFISENNINHIEINSSYWFTEIVNLKIDISNNHIFDFYADGEIIRRECFSYFEYNEITIGESEFELDQQTGVYRIFVE